MLLFFLHIYYICAASLWHPGIWNTSNIALQTHKNTNIYLHTISNNFYQAFLDGSSTLKSKAHLFHSNILWFFFLTLNSYLQIKIDIKIYLSVYYFQTLFNFFYRLHSEAADGLSGLWARLYRHLAAWRRYFRRVTILCYHWSKMSPSPCWPMAPVWPRFARAHAPPPRSVPQVLARTHARTQTLHSVMLSAAWVMKQI